MHMTVFVGSINAHGRSAAEDANGTGGLNNESCRDDSVVGVGDVRSCRCSEVVSGGAVNSCHEGANRRTSGGKATSGRAWSGV